MRILVAGFVALTFVAGIAGPTYATVGKVNGKKVFEKLDKEGRGGHNN